MKRSAEGCHLATGTSGEESTLVDVLYTAELVHDRGIYTLIIRDLILGTQQTTEVPRNTVDKIPKYLSMLDLQQS